MAKKVAPAQLFTKFGEFDSAEELNKTAAGLRAEGDIQGLQELAKENGIDPYEVEDYVDGMSDELATPITAALGRMRVELETLEGSVEAMCRFYSGVCHLCDDGKRGSGKRNHEKRRKAQRNL